MSHKQLGRGIVTLSRTGTTKTVGEAFASLVTKDDFGSTGRPQRGGYIERSFLHPVSVLGEDGGTANIPAGTVVTFFGNPHQDWDRNVRVAFVAGSKTNPQVTLFGKGHSKVRDPNDRVGTRKTGKSGRIDSSFH